MILTLAILIGSWLVLPVVGALTFQHFISVPGRHRNWS